VKNELNVCPQKTLLSLSFAELFFKFFIMESKRTNKHEQKEVLPNQTTLMAPPLVKRHIHILAILIS